MQLQNSIKRMNLYYAKCPKGGLHTGELLNLVCVDSKCPRRGLICPICRMQNHEQCQILPLKVFLEQIKKLFLESEDSSSLNNLSDYLRSIENSKKQLINILKDAAEAIASQFQNLQTKIHENYTIIRRNVLTQSSISTKLPNLVNLLTQTQEKDALALQEEFQKYSDLLKYENSKMTVCDKAKKLVEDYSSQPNIVKSLLNAQVTTMKQKFQEILTNKSKENKPEQNKQVNLTFSQEQKSTQLKLADNDKRVYTTDELENLGFAYIEQGIGDLNRKITFEIVSSTSEAIVLGMGFPDKDKEIAYLYNQPIKGQHFIAQISGYNEIPDNQSSMEMIDSFTYLEIGSQITVHLEGSNDQVCFTKKNTDLKRVVSLGSMSEEDKKKLQFFVVLAESDSVKIVE